MSAHRAQPFLRNIIFELKMDFSLLRIWWLFRFDSVPIIAVACLLVAGKALSFQFNLWKLRIAWWHCARLCNLQKKKTKQCGFNVIKIVDNLYVNNVSLVSVEEKNQINFKVALLPFWSLKKIYLGLVTFDQVYPCIPRMRVIKIQKYCDFSFLDRFDKQRCCQLICKPSQGGPLSWRRRQLR